MTLVLSKTFKGRLIITGYGTGTFIIIILEFIHISTVFCVFVVKAIHKLPILFSMLQKKSYNCNERREIFKMKDNQYIC